MECVISEGGHVDLVICSGVIQYLAEPYTFLKTLVYGGVDLILFSRMSFSLELEEIFSVQKTPLSAHGPGIMPEGFKDSVIKCPHINIRKDMFEKIMEKKYQLLFFFEDMGGVLKVKGKDIVGLGMLYKKIN